VALPKMTKTLTTSRKHLEPTFKRRKHHQREVGISNHPEVRSEKSL